MRNKKGFTLLELLVVIAVIGLLSTFALVAFGNARAKARDSKRMADVQQIRRALEIRHDAVGTMPVCVTAASCLAVSQSNANINELGVDITCIDSLDFSSGATTCNGTTYMPNIPQDPGDPNNGTACIAASSPNAACNYSYNRGIGSGNETDNYEIYYLLESGSGSFNAGVHCATELGMGSNTSNACAH